MKDSGMASDALAYSRVWLRFADPETERHFARRALLDSMLFIRIYLLAGTALYILFGLLDAQVGGKALTTIYIIRYAICCPILLTNFALSFTRYFQKIGQYVLALQMAASGLGIVAMTAIMPAPPRRRAMPASSLIIRRRREGPRAATSPSAPCRSCPAHPPTTPPR